MALETKPVRWFPVQSYSDDFELSFEKSSLLGSLGSIEYHQDEIACLHYVNKENVMITSFSDLRGRDNLPSSALAL